MNRTEEEPVFGTKLALRLGTVFLAVYAVLAILAAVDHAQRPRLEALQDVRESAPVTGK